MRHSPKFNSLHIKGHSSSNLYLGYPCGGILRATTGIIHSPDIDRDGLYDHSSNCEWYILAGQQQVVELNVHIIKIETTNECRYDYLKVRVYFLVL